MITITSGAGRRMGDYSIIKIRGGGIVGGADG